MDTDEILLNMVKDRPQELCKCCGRCCRVSTTSLSYEQLQERVNAGDKYAKDFCDIFIPFKNQDEARKVDNEIVKNILSKISEDEGKKLTFYSCKFLGKNNLCRIYEKRPLLCRLAPRSCFAIVPPGCGFEIWLKEKQKEHIKKIEYYNSIILELEDYLKITENKDRIAHIKKIIDNTKKILEDITK